MPPLKIPNPKVIFSGIQPTGVPHLGNYVGALRQWVQLQRSEPDAKLIYSIVDLHAITMPQPPEQLKRRKREALAALLAIGIDPERATLFYQSSVSVVLYLLTSQKSIRLYIWVILFHCRLIVYRSQPIQNSCGFSAAQHPLGISHE